MTSQEILILGLKIRLKNSMGLERREGMKGKSVFLLCQDDHSVSYLNQQLPSHTRTLIGVIFSPPPPLTEYSSVSLIAGHTQLSCQKICR